MERHICQLKKKRFFLSTLNLRGIILGSRQGNLDGDHIWQTENINSKSKFQKGLDKIIDYRSEIKKVIQNAYPCIQSLQLWWVQGLVS